MNFIANKRLRLALSALLAAGAGVHLAAAVYYWFERGFTWELGPIEISLHQWEKPWATAMALWLAATLVRPRPYLPLQRFSAIRPWAFLGAALGGGLGAQIFHDLLYFLPGPGCAIRLTIIGAFLGAFIHILFAFGVEQAGSRWTLDKSPEYRAGLRGGLYVLFLLALARWPLADWEGRFFDPIKPFLAGAAVSLLLTVAAEKYWRNRRGLLITALAGLLIASLGFDLIKRRSISGPGPRDRVIVITLDTTRADHVSSYGYFRNTTPNIDREAARGVLFKKAICPMDGTDMSHASMFTGFYPRTHGVINTGLPITGKVSSLPEFFHDRGFRTAAIVSRTQLDPHKIMNLPGFEYASVPYRGGYEATAPEVFRRTANWLIRHRTEDAFVWAHFFDPHGDYLPHPDFPNRFSDEKKDCHAKSRLSPGETISAEEIERCVDLYDTEIAYMDFWVGRLIDFVNNLEPKSERPALIVLIGDHGETMGEYQAAPDLMGFGHGGIMHEATVRIPFIVAWPGVIPAGKVVEEVAETVDLAPTLADLVFGAAYESQGLSLKALLLGQGGGDDLGIYQRWTSTGFKDRPDMAVAKYAIYGGPLKLIVGDDAGPLLYNIDDDPGEAQDLAGGKPDEVKRLHGDWEKWMETTPLTEPGKSTIDRDGWRALRALGYVQ